MPLSDEHEIYVPQGNTLVRSAAHPLGMRDLSFQGVETQYSTHGIHPYVAAINPPLVSALIDHFVPAGGSILDPYCGGGGVLVEGVLKGRTAAGNDINPLAVRISKAKTTYVPRAAAEGYLQELLRAYEAAEIPADEVKAIPQTVRYWFKDYMLEPVLRLKKALGALEGELGGNDEGAAVTGLFQVAFSAAIREIMLTYRGEVRLRKLQGADLERFQPDVLNVFKKRADLGIERAGALPEGAGAEVLLQDARDMPYRDGQFSTVICSPPYGDDKNGVGYFQFSSKMLYFLGYDDLKPYRKQFLGGVKEDKTVPPSAILLDSLEHVRQRDLAHYREAVAFYSDYYTALREMGRVAADRIVIVVGNRVLSRTAFDNAMITVEMFDSLGIGLEHYFQRTLPKKRIANLGGDGGGGNVEHILVFRR